MAHLRREIAVYKKNTSDYPNITQFGPLDDNIVSTEFPIELLGYKGTPYSGGKYRLKASHSDTRQPPNFKFETTPYACCVKDFGELDVNSPIRSGNDGWISPSLISNKEIFSDYYHLAEKPGLLEIVDKMWRYICTHGNVSLPPRAQPLAPFFFFFSRACRRV